MISPPVRFSEKASVAAKKGGYPVQISAGDLDKNFIYCALDAPITAPAGNPQPFEISESAGEGGHIQRNLLFSPPPPLDGNKFLFSFTGGAFAWEPPSIPDGSASGQLLQWSSEAEAWELLTPGIAGQLLQWNPSASSWQFITPSSQGQILKWNSNSWEFITPSNKALLYFEGSDWQFLSAGESGQYLTGDFLLGSFCNDVKTCMDETITGLDERITVLENNDGGSIIPPAPSSGTHVLGAVDGVLTWIATEEC